MSLTPCNLYMQHISNVELKISTKTAGEIMMKINKHEWWKNQLDFIYLLVKLQANWSKCHKRLLLVSYMMMNMIWNLIRKNTMRWTWFVILLYHLIVIIYLSSSFCYCYYNYLLISDVWWAGNTTVWSSFKSAGNYSFW